MWQLPPCVPITQSQADKFTNWDGVELENLAWQQDPEKSANQDQDYTMVSTSKHGQEPVLCMQPSQVLTLAGVVSGCLTRMLPAAVANIEGSKDRTILTNTTLCKEEGNQTGENKLDEN